MRHVETTHPSFPQVEPNHSLACPDAETWHVVCGDTGHWRVGIYSPKASAKAELHELERHDCPEFFLLTRGRLTLVVFEDGGCREIVLEPGQPVLVTAPHNGYCPDGPHTGAAVVVERDAFRTEYRTVPEWMKQS